MCRREEREQRRADIEHLASSLVNSLGTKVNECVAAIEEERTVRVEMEARTVSQVGADLLSLQERVETEKAQRCVQGVACAWHGCLRPCTGLWTGALCLRSASHTHTHREADVNQLRGEVHEVLGNRNHSDEKFQVVVLEEIAGLKVREGGGAGSQQASLQQACKTLRGQCLRGCPSHCVSPCRCCVCTQSALAVEREERVAEDDELVAAVNDYTRALQDGLRILATS